MKQTETTLCFTKPTRFDMAPYKTLWKYDYDGEERFWIQVNKTPEPGIVEWVELGAFLLKVLRRPIEDDSFMSECLRIYSEEISLPESNLRHILSEIKNDEAKVDL